MPKCPKECGKCNPFIFRKSVIPAQVADDTVTPPKIGAYCNALVVYEATGNAYLFSSDGIPTLLSATDYELLANLPSINGVTVVGDLTLEDLGIAQLVEAEAKTRAGADTYLQEQIDAITLSSDVVDIVGTYQELEDYDTSHLSENDIIKVLADETVGGATTYYRWVNNSWEYIGEEGPYYTKSQTDALLDEKLDADALDDYYDKDEVDDLLDDKADVSALADKQDKLIAGSNITIDQATNVISATVPSLDNYYTKSETYSQNEVDGLISGVEAQIPTSTSQLVNDSGFLTSIPIASANDLGGIKVGSGLSIDASGVLSATAPSITVDSSLSTTSTNPVQNKVITSALNNKADISDIPVVPSNISAFYNDVGYVTSATVAQNYYNKSETYTQNEVDGLISGVEAQIPTKTSDLSNDGSDGTSTYVEADDLATVATSGSYNDLLNKPTIYDPEDFYWANVKISDTSSTSTAPTFKRVTFSGSDHPHIAASGTLTFSADGNWSAGNHGNIVLQTTSFRPSSDQSGAMDLGAAAGTGIWRNLYLSGGIYHGTYLLTLPDKAGTVALLSDLPTVNNATLTIQENGSTVGTFTANASSNVTANITVPTKTSDLTNDSGFITASDEQQCEDGANISIDNPNSSPVPLSSVELLGNTTQVNYTGKNLLNPSRASSSTIGGVTIDYDDATQVFTLNGTGTSDNTGFKFTSSDIDLDGTYTLSFEVLGGSISNITSSTRIQLANSGWSQNIYLALGNSSASTTKTVTFFAIKTNNGVRYDTGVTFNNYKFRIQLEKNSQATSWEPFCGGIPAPNPTYPIAVQTTTGRQVVEMRGKNVYDATTAQATSQGLTYSGDTGYIYLNGTRTGNGGINWANGYLPAGKYKLMLELVSGSITSTSNGQLFFVYGANITFSPSEIALSSNKPKGSITLTVSADTTNAHINSWARTTETCTNAVIKYQIVRGEDDDYDFEPYQSQSYEVNLGKNLFDGETVNGWLNASGVLQSSTSDRTSTNYIAVQPNTTYTLHGTNSTYLKFTQFNGSKTAVSQQTTTSATTLTATTGASTAYVRIGWGNVSSASNVQLELGSTATTYAPYFTPIELCKLGAYQDKIYKSGDDWFVHKEVGKVVLDGSENWNALSYGGYTYELQTALQVPTSPSELLVLSGHFLGTSYDDRTQNIPNSIYMSEPGHKVNIRNTSWTTVEQFKTWLASNNTTVYYALATPTTTTITNQALIDQLNALKAASLYAGENNIMLIPAGGAQGTLDLCFYSSTLPVATSGSLGAVAVGDGLSITDAGVLSVDPPVPTKVSELTNDSSFVTGSIVKASGDTLGTTTINSTTANYMEVTKLTTATDLNTLQTTGIYIVGASGNTNAPTANWGTVFVDWTGGTKYQMYIPDGDNTTIYKRKYSSSTWGSWAPMDKVKYTSYNISPASDTTAAWKTVLGGEGTYFTWYNTNGKFTNQPAQYGFLRTIIGGQDIRQDFWTQTGGTHYFRAGNGAGWYGTAGNAGAFRNINVNNGTLTIQKNGTNVQTFTANQSSNATANITVPTKTSDLINDSNFVSDANYVHTDNNYTTTDKNKLAGIAAGAEVNVQSDWNVTNSSSDAFIKNKPTIPTVNNGTLTIQKNGTNVQTFTANQSSNATANITVPTKTSDLTNDGEDGTAEYLEDDETAYQTASIPYGACDSTSTATAFTATVPGITELRDGVCMWLKNGVVTSASGFTININGLGAKPVYQNMAAASAETTLFNVNYTMFFVYDSTRVSGGCWILYRGYNANDDYRAYQVRANSSTLPMKSATYRYRLLFTSGDDKNFVPATNSTSSNATDSRTVCQDKINPFGSIFYYGSTATVAANSRPGASSLWQQYAISLGYSFNRTGAALALTSWKPVYVKAAPQTDGSAIIDSTTPYVQNLPTTEDGKIYIFLGVAYSATNIELLYNHPVYYYKDGAIRPYVNPPANVGQKIFYATCSTASNVDMKEATTTNGDFVLETGAMVRVVFDNAPGSFSTTKLRVDNTTAKPIIWSETAQSRTSIEGRWSAGEAVDFVYDGANYLMCDSGTASTSRYGVTMLSDSTSNSRVDVAATANAVRQVKDAIPTTTSQLTNDGSSGNNLYLTNDLDFGAGQCIGRYGTGQYVYKWIFNGTSGTAVNTWTALSHTLDMTDFTTMVSIKAMIRGSGNAEYYPMNSDNANFLIYFSGGTFYERHSNSYYNNRGMMIEVEYIRSSLK